MHIQSVLGPIAPEDLGFCQCHEHLWIERGQSARINPDLRIDSFARSLQELALYRAAGGQALVDAQPVGCGRNAGRLAELSQQSGVHIIASTGFHKMLFYPEEHWIFRWDAEQLAELFSAEVLRGMYSLCDREEPGEQTPHRAGQIKTALDSGTLTPQYEKLFDAAGEAAKKTGAALMVHIEQGADPLALVDRLYRQGVQLERVIFCHMDRSVADLAVHREVCSRGILLEYDTVARGKYHDDARECAIVAAMLEAGYANRLLLSLDVTRARLVSYGGDVGLAYIRERFLPLLHQSGVSEAQLEDIFVHNPARVFTLPCAL